MTDKTDERLAVVETDVAWIKKLQLWQLGLLVGQLAATGALASRLLGGPSPAQAAETVARFFT